MELVSWKAFFLKDEMNEAYVKKNEIDIKNLHEVANKKVREQ